MPTGRVDPSDWTRLAAAESRGARRLGDMEARHIAEDLARRLTEALSDLELRPHPELLLGVPDAAIVAEARLRGFPVRETEFKPHLRNLRKIMPYLEQIVTYLLENCIHHRIVFLLRDAELVADAFQTVVRNTALSDRVLVLPLSGPLRDQLPPDSAEAREFMNQFIDFDAISSGDHEVICFDIGFEGNAIVWFNNVIRSAQGEPLLSIFGEPDGMPVRGLLVKSKGPDHFMTELAPRYPQIPLREKKNAPVRMLTLPKHCNTSSPTFDINLGVAAALQVMPKFTGHVDRLSDKVVGGRALRFPTSSQEEGGRPLYGPESVEVKPVRESLHAFDRVRQDWLAPVDPIAALRLQAAVVRRFDAIRRRILSPAHLREGTKETWESDLEEAIEAQRKSALESHRARMNAIANEVIRQLDLLDSDPERTRIESDFAVTFDRAALGSLAQITADGTSRAEVWAQCERLASALRARLADLSPALRAANADALRSRGRIVVELTRASTLRPEDEERTVSRLFAARGYVDYLREKIKRPEGDTLYDVFEGFDFKTVAGLGAHALTTELEVLPMVVAHQIEGRGPGLDHVATLADILHAIAENNAPGFERSIADSLLVVAARTGWYVPENKLPVQSMFGGILPAIAEAIADSIAREGFRDLSLEHLSTLLPRLLALPASIRVETARVAIETARSAIETAQAALGTGSHAHAATDAAALISLALRVLGDPPIMSPGPNAEKRASERIRGSRSRTRARSPLPTR